MKIWTTKLEKCQQQPDKSVNNYTCVLLELYRRIEIQAF